MYKYELWLYKMYNTLLYLTVCTGNKPLTSCGYELNLNVDYGINPMLHAQLQNEIF